MFDYAVDREFETPIGPITVFNYTVYAIMTPRGTNYLGFMCWIGLSSFSSSWGQRHFTDRHAGGL